MGLIEIVIALLIVGLVLYLIDFIPIDGTIKQVIRVVVIVFVIIWLLQALVGGGSLNFLRIR